MPQSHRSKQNNTAILSGLETGGIAIIRAQTENKSQLSSERTSWNHGGTERALSSPACCRQRNEYPPGYTVFECRLDGNQPIAQVVQVPPDTRDTTLQDKTCMILETKQSEFGPSSRVAAYPGQKNTRSACNRSALPGPMSFDLEARDRPDGAVACARKTVQHRNSSVAYAQPVTTLETTKGTTYQDGPSSTLTYGPVSDDTVRASSKNYKPPAFYIQCATTAGGSVARVTQVPQDFRKNSGDTATRYETFVQHDGSCPIATVTQSNEKAVSDDQRACEYLETRVCPSGPRARALTFPDSSSNFSHFTHLNVKPRENGPSARISQQPGDPQKMILNHPDNRRTAKTPAVCCCEPISEPVARVRSPCGFGNTNRIMNGGSCGLGRRNGLTPTSLEMNCRAGPFTCNGVKKQRTNMTPKTCPPSALAGRTSPLCKVQSAPCAKKRIQMCEEKSPILWPTPCACSSQSSPKPVEYPCFEKHPLPGGCVVSQRPIGFLPDIAPVQLGPNRLRDYKPRPKNAGPRKGTSSTRRKPTVEVFNKSAVAKSNKPTESSQEQTSKKTKHKKVPPEKRERALVVSQVEKDEALLQVPSETYVECPAYASKGSQSDPVQQEPVYVQCPEYEERTVQSLAAYESKRKKSVAHFEEPAHVRCPAFERSISSGSSSEYMAREDDLIRQYPEYSGARTVETSLACRAKRNRLQDECHLYIPDSMLRMSYEQRRNRHARTLVSNCSRRRRFVDNETPETKYCVRSELPSRSAKHRVQNHETDHQNHEYKVPASNGKKADGQHEKHDESYVSTDVGKTKHSLKAVKSRELRAGVVYYDCDCYHRNGLQQDCPRGGCGGLTHCTSKPWPSCNLSRYFKKKWGKYGDLLDLIPPSTYCGPRDAFYKAKIGKIDRLTAEENGMKTDKCLEKQADGQSAKQEDKTCKLKRYHSAQSQRTAHDGKSSKNHDRMVREYAMIPITDVKNNPRTQ